MKNKFAVGDIVRCSSRKYQVADVKNDPEEPNSPFYVLEEIEVDRIWRKAESLERISRLPENRD